MKSKIDRLSDAIKNIEEAIKYYLVDADSKYRMHKMSRKEYEKLIKDFRDISIILSNFKKMPVVKNSKLDEIRIASLEISQLLEEGDYNTIFVATANVNNILCKEAKEKDRKRLGDLKRIYNSLSKFYQYRLSKAENKPTEGLTYRDKGLDNVKFITENYLIIKYNFKKIKYELLNIDSTYQDYIDEYAKIIDSSDGDVRERYIDIRNHLLAYAKAEIVIRNLEMVMKLCDEPAYFGIREQAKVLVDKYTQICVVNKAKYNLLVGKFDTSMMIGTNKINEATLGEEKSKVKK